MPYANIQVAQSDTDFGTTVGPNSSAAMDVTLSLIGVTANSTLVVVGTMFLTSGWPYAKCSGVASTGDTWSTPAVLSNGYSNSGTFYTAARSFVSVASGVTSGNKTVTVSFNGSDPFNGEATQSVESTKGVQYRLALIEITNARTSGAIDLIVSNVVTSGTSTAVVTGELAQTDNIQIWCHGTYTGYSGVPSGFTSLMTKSNGDDSLHGAVIAHRKVTSSASTTITQNHTETTTAVGGFVIVIKAADASGVTYRYNFQLDPAEFTSADTGIEAHVWRNGESYEVVAERYTGLSGDATAGTLLITTGLPTNVDVTDTIKADLFNTTHASAGKVTGTVEAV